MSDITPPVDDLMDCLRSLDLASVACSAAIDSTGALGAVNLAGKIEAATARHRLGLLHGLVIAAAEQGVDQRLLAGEGDALPIKKAPTFAEAIQAIDALSRPRRVVADRVPGTFEIFGVDTPQPFDGETYQHLPLLKRVPRERLPRGRDAEGPDDTSRLRDLPLERWEEQLWGESGQFEETTIPLEQALHDWVPGSAPRVILIGPPGSGKSTLLDYIAHACLRREPPLTIGGRQLLPVRIGLRQWESWCGDNHRYNLIEYLEAIFSGRGAPSSGLWRQWLATGRVLLLLDGLDELSGDTDFYTQALKGLLNDRDMMGSPIILTCRTISYEGHRGLAPHLPVYTLGGLSPRQQAAFIRSYPAQEADFDTEGLIEELRRLPNLRPLAANPLLLSIICLVVSGQKAVSLPASRGALYEAAITRMLSRRPRVPPKEIYVGFAEPLPAEKKVYLEELALELWLRDEGRRLIFDEQTLIAALKRVLRRADESMRLARCLVRDWVGNSGLLRRAAGGQYAWLHLTIQEYMVANVLASRLNGPAKGGWNGAKVTAAGKIVRVNALLEDKAWDAGWQEVICLLAGRLDRPEELLALLAGETPEETPLDVGFWLLRLSGRCLGEIRACFLPQELASRIVRGLAMLPYSASTQTGELGAAALALTRHPKAAEALLEALRTGVPQVRRAAARALENFSTKDVVEGLLVAFGDEDWHVGKAAAGALGTIDGPDVERHLRAALFDTNQHHRIREFAAAALGIIGTSEAVAALGAALQERDFYTYVQTAAAHALGAIGTFESVDHLRVASDHAEKRVREAATQALNTIATQRAEEDPSQFADHEETRVRRAGTGDPNAKRATDTKMWITALSDPHPQVRLSAAKKLAEDATIAIMDPLQTVLGDQDEFWDIRVAAAEALGNINESQAVGALLAAIGSEDRGERRAASAGFAKIRDNHLRSQVLDHLVEHWSEFDPDDFIPASGWLTSWIPSISCQLRWPTWRTILAILSSYMLVGGLDYRPTWANEAESLCRRLLQTAPSFSPALLRLGWLLYAWPDRGDDVRRLLEHYAWQFPDTDEFWTLRGGLCDRLDDMQGALEAYRAAVKPADGPDDRARCLRSCAAACLQLELVSEAVECLREAEALVPDHPMLHLRWAEIHLAQGNLPAALVSATLSVERAGEGEANALQLTHGLVLLCCGHVEEAAAAYGRGLEHENQWIVVSEAAEDLERELRRRGNLPGSGEMRVRLHEAAERLRAMWPTPTWRGEA